MALDAIKNLAYSTVATAPSPASSGTSLVVAAGEGTRFPAVSFNAIIWPSGAVPTPANAEIVRVTNIATDTFTITRTQESTSARTVVIGDQIAAIISKKWLDDLVATIPVVVGGWDSVVFTTADRATTNSTLTDIPDLSVALAINSWYEFEALLWMDSSTTAGGRVAHAYSAAGAIGGCNGDGALNPASSNTTWHTQLGAAGGTSASIVLTTASTKGAVFLKGFVVTGANAGNLTIQQLKITSGTITTYKGSVLKVRKVA